MYGWARSYKQCKNMGIFSLINSNQATIILFRLLLSTNCRCRGLSLHLITLNHTHTNTQSVGFLWANDRPFAEASIRKKHNNHKIQISMHHSGIRNRNSSRRVAADLRLRKEGNGYQRPQIGKCKFLFNKTNQMH